MREFLREEEGVLKEKRGERGGRCHLQREEPLWKKIRTEENKEEGESGGF